MRRVLVAVAAALLVSAPALADSPSEVLLDWQEGTFTVGGPVETSANAATWPVWLDACHRRLSVDLLYEPEGLNASVGGTGVERAHRFEVRLEAPNATLVRTVAASGHGHALGEVPEVGWANLTLRLEDGADVDWRLRLRGWAIDGERACTPTIRVVEVEANPPGSDSGNEWVELHNPGTYEVDLTGWTLSTTHGRTVDKALDGTLGRDGRTVVGHPTQWIDNEDERLVLTRPDGTVADRSPILDDTADDGRSWQLDGGDWVFADATPGEAP